MTECVLMMPILSSFVEGKKAEVPSQLSLSEVAIIRLQMYYKNIWLNSGSSLERNFALRSGIPPFFAKGEAGSIF